MNHHEIFIHMIYDNLNDMIEAIDCLYMTANAPVKNALLTRMQKDVANIAMMVQGLQDETVSESPQPGAARIFTAAELAGYNGRDGSPAYVAVSGVVYDVTNVAAWGGATHFGLTAGTDASSQFASCHAGQPILSKLKVVGKMSG